MRSLIDMLDCVAASVTLPWNGLANTATPTRRLGACLSASTIVIAAAVKNSNRFLMVFVCVYISS
jgi:hypothetical protein